MICLSTLELLLCFPFGSECVHFAKSKHMLLKSKKILLKFCWQFLTKRSSGLDFILDYGIVVCMSSCQQFRSVFCFM